MIRDCDPTNHSRMKVVLLDQNPLHQHIYIPVLYVLSPHLFSQLARRRLLLNSLSVPRLWLAPVIWTRHQAFCQSAGSDYQYIVVCIEIKDFLTNGDWLFPYCVSICVSTCADVSITVFLFPPTCPFSSSPSSQKSG